MSDIGIGSKSTMVSVCAFVRVKSQIINVTHVYNGEFNDEF